MIQDVAQLGLKGCTITPGTVNIVLPPSRYDAILAILGDPNLVTGNIKYGATIFNVAGKASVVDTSDATATAANIRNVGGANNTSAYVNGVKEIGTMPDKVGSATVFIPGASAIPITQGYYGGAAGDGEVAAVSVPVADLLTGQTVAGQAGTMPENGSPTLQPGASITAGHYSGGSVANYPHNSQTYASGSGTFTVPTGVTEIIAAICGGAAGGGHSNASYPGGGGGSGGTAFAVLSVTPGQQISYSIGVGGGSNNPGNATTFGSITANGGGVGTYAVGGVEGTTSGSGIVYTIGSPGSGQAIGGGSGSGGNSFFGVGGASQTGYSYAGNPGGIGAGGSGGGAGSPGAAGGAGGNGQIVIWW